MSSINLLPENYIGKTKSREESHKSYLYMVLSFLLIFISMTSTIGLYFYNRYYKEKVNSISMEMKDVDEQMRKATEGNELLAAENKAKNIKYLLSEHTYLTEVSDFFQKTMLNEVYFKTLDIAFEKNVLNVKFEASTEDYISSAIQVAIFKGSPLVNNVSVDSVSVNKEGGVSFSGALILKNDLIFKRTVQFESSSLSEDESVGFAKLKINIPYVSTSEVSVDYAVTGGTATAKKEGGKEYDYELAKGKIKIPAGKTSAELSIPITDDLSRESDETIIVTLSNPINAIMDTNDKNVKVVHTYTIVDNDSSN